MLFAYYCCIFSDFIWTTGVAQINIYMGTAEQQVAMKDIFLDNGKIIPASTILDSYYK